MTTTSHCHQNIACCLSPPTPERDVQRLQDDSAVSANSSVPAPYAVAIEAERQRALPRDMVVDEGPRRSVQVLHGPARIIREELSEVSPGARRVRRWTAAPAINLVQKGTRALRRGHRGPSVRRLQKMLDALGFELVQDGYFGSKTQAALEEFQEQAGVSGRHGRLGSVSLKALRDRYEARANQVMDDLAEPNVFLRAGSTPPLGKLSPRIRAAVDALVDEGVGPISGIPGRRRLFDILVDERFQSSFGDAEQFELLYSVGTPSDLERIERRFAKMPL